MTPSLRGDGRAATPRAGTTTEASPPLVAALPAAGRAVVRPEVAFSLGHVDAGTCVVPQGARTQYQDSHDEDAIQARTRRLAEPEKRRFARRVPLPVDERA